MPRIYITLQQDLVIELEKFKKEKGHLNIQDTIRDIIGEWFAKRKKE